MWCVQAWIGYSAPMQRANATDRRLIATHDAAEATSRASRGRRFGATGTAALATLLASMSAAIGLFGCDRPEGAAGAVGTVGASTAQTASAPSSASASSTTGAGSTAATPNESTASATPVANGAAQPASPAAAPETAQPVLGPVHQLSVVDLEGNKVSLAKFAGRPMIIEIWATWCGPCRANRRNVHELKTQGRLPERLAVVGVSVDTGASLVKGFLKSNPGNEAEFMASPEFNEFVRARNASPSIPKTLYVDSKGRVADLAEGVQTQKWLEAMARNLR
jgi:thiol-disulfide isomerase/thioredoxin